MMVVEQFVSKPVLERLAQAVSAGRLAHAYLFMGPKRIGKKETALAVAKLVNCERLTAGTFCDGCSSCAKINNGRHPDVHLLGQEEGSIKIEEVRDLLAQAQLRAFEARIKVFIIADVERLTLEASNALLKTLEEPAKNTLILLTTSIPDSVLDTIKSRCQVMYFFPRERDQLQKQFVDADRLSEAEAYFLACFAEGCPGRVMPGEAKAILVRRNKAIDQFIFTREDEAYMKEILKDPSQVAEMLHFLFCWFKDMLVLKLDAGSAHVMNLDRTAELERMRDQYDFREVEEILNDIVKTRKALEENFNVKVPLALLKERAWRK